MADDQGGGKRAYGVNKARPSFSHLADKFNTAPPPGYVAGRGRGIGGFSKPTAEDLKFARRFRAAGPAVRRRHSQVCRARGEAVRTPHASDRIVR